MFYAGVSSLLARASDVLAGDANIDDDRSRRQRRLIVTLTRRLGLIVPHLFATLEQEIEILEAVCSEMRARLGPDFAAAALAEFDAAEPLGGPLLRYRRLVLELDVATTTLHESDHGEPWIREARRIIRRSLAELAAVEGQLVDLMLAA